MVQKGTIVGIPTRAEKKIKKKKTFPLQKGSKSCELRFCEIKWLQVI